MNPSTILTFNANMIFVVVGGLIILSMIMGRKNRTTNRTSMGWWIGLVQDRCQRPHQEQREDDPSDPPDGLAVAADEDAVEQRLEHP
jgi:hypothetical protein